MKIWKSVPPSSVGGFSGLLVAYEADRICSGRLHITNPNCVHLGCCLSFNSELESWDCPCHGSRFDVDGKLIDNSSAKDLT